MTMTVERALRLIAGVFLLTSIALGHWVSPWWYLFTVFVSLSLIQSGLTDWCPMVWVLQKLGLPRAGVVESGVAGPQ